MITLTANRRKATVTETETITTGSVGIPVRLDLSSDFDGLAVTVCFKAGERHADRVWTGGTVNVPEKCLRCPGVPLEVGVYAARADGTVVIPTMLASAGTIRQGVEPSGVDPGEPDPSWIAQMQKMAQDAQAVAEEMAAYLDTVEDGRVTSLDGTQLSAGAIEVLGTPAYVTDVAEYGAYGITDPGWYVFARIAAPRGTAMDGTTVTGAAGYIVGDGHVDVAVAFEVAAMSQEIAVTWTQGVTEAFAFKATDLAVRNLDYRVTFYVYDLADYATWEWEEATGAFVGTEYWEVDEEAEIGHSRAAVITGQPIPAETYYTRSYALTTDTTFQEETVYYTKSGTVYTPAEVTPGAAVTANTYYVDVWTEAKGFFVGTKVYHTKSGDTYTPVAVMAGDTAPTYYVDAYELTTDETFQDGTTYYTLEGGVYTAAEVTAGEDVPADTYYVHSYELVEGGVFADGVTYYTKSGTAYTAAEVTAGEDVPDLYWQHSKLTIEGMVRNVTYKLDTALDCPAVIVLPEIEEDGHGAWYEMQVRTLAAQSLTLQLEDALAKVAANGFGSYGNNGSNTTTLHYTSLAGLRLWRATNIAANLPTT